ncbi:hypothetical protein HJC23_000299 [Cyclotella cryptica]|uniref:PPIase cyclophilin-type domain-containing protein n=1 Tax=Cyclotella cryptica TaxID=29204 RepID=A0ABD3NVQ0_9STRA|eukprot:CCRYP_019361-RA/>CCRYP_019361-RA protein AED:0.01 eAED:0.01 QI:122/1/1/1/0/0/2/1385/541
MANAPQAKEATASPASPEADSSNNSQNPTHSTNTASKPPSKSTVLLASCSIALLLLGTLLGGFVTSRLLDSEYQQIIAKLRVNYQTSLTHSKEDRRTCLEEREAEKQPTQDAALLSSHEASLRSHEEWKACQSQSIQTERMHQQEMERQLLATNRALEDANAGLERASHRLKQTRKEYQHIEFELERRKLEWNETTRKYHETVQQLQDATGQLERVQSTLSTTEGQLANAERELEAAGREFDRRDVERAECDKTHREMISCQKMLKDALGGTGKEEICVSTIGQLDRDKTDLLQELSAVKSERDRVFEEISFLQQHRTHLEEQLSGFSLLATEHERERDELREQTVAVYEKIQNRDRQFVLDRYGPGPYRVEVVIELPTEIPTHESLILELGPLDIMPHTIKTFLEMIERETYIDGTFILAKDHIILGGPSDLHDAENNQRLTERMLQHGYHPDGALLFNEYSDEYPHVQGTVGFTAGKSGPMFYINLINNSEIHGALKDPCFAKFIRGFDLLERIAQMPKGEDGSFESPIYIVRTEVVND